MEAVAAEALAQAEAAEQRAYHASSKTGAQLQDTKLAQHGANASEAMEKQLAPSLKARAADVAALSPRKVTPTKKGLVSP